MINTNEKQWTWIPNIRLNNLYFNKPYKYFDDFIKNKYLLDWDEINDSELTYKSDAVGGFFSFSKKEKIFEGAEIWSNLYFNNINLINISEEVLKNILMVNDLVFNKSGEFYSSEVLDAIFWITDGVVESVSL